MAYNDLWKSTKRRETMRRMFGFLIGIFVGWLVGSTIALLLAPKTGEKLRGELRARSNNFFGEIRSATDMRRKQLEDQLDAMRAPRLPSKS
jgi:gas vesicle protein